MAWNLFKSDKKFERIGKKDFKDLIKKTKEFDQLKKEFDASIKYRDLPSINYLSEHILKNIKEQHADLMDIANSYFNLEHRLNLDIKDIYEKIAEETKYLKTPKLKILNQRFSEFIIQREADLNQIRIMANVEKKES